MFFVTEKLTSTDQLDTKKVSRNGKRNLEIKNMRRSLKHEDALISAWISASINSKPLSNNCQNDDSLKLSKYCNRLSVPMKFSIAA